MELAVAACLFASADDFNSNVEALKSLGNHSVGNWNQGGDDDVFGNFSPAPTPPPTLWTISTLVQRPSERAKAYIYYHEIEKNLTRIRASFPSMLKSHRISQSEFQKLTKLQKEGDHLATELKDMQSYQLVTRTTSPTQSPTRTPTSVIEGLMGERWRGKTEHIRTPTKRPTHPMVKKLSTVDIMAEIEKVYSLETKMEKKDELIANATKHFHVHSNKESSSKSTRMTLAPTPTLLEQLGGPPPSTITPTATPTTAPTWMNIIAKILAKAAEKRKELSKSAAPIQGAMPQGGFPTPMPFHATFDTSLGAHFNQCYGKCYAYSDHILKQEDGVSIDDIVKPSFLRQTNFDPCEFAYFDHQPPLKIKMARRLCKCMLGEISCKEWKQGHRYLPYTLELPKAYNQLVSANCVGHWGDWGLCNCAAHSKKRTFVVDRGAVNKGKGCISYPQEMECHCRPTLAPTSRSFSTKFQKVLGKIANSSMPMLKSLPTPTPTTYRPNPKSAQIEQDTDAVFSDVFSSVSHLPSAIRTKTPMHKLADDLAPGYEQKPHSYLYDKLEHEQETKWDKGGF